MIQRIMTTTLFQPPTVANIGFSSVHNGALYFVVGASPKISLFDVWWRTPQFVIWKLHPTLFITYIKHSLRHLKVSGTFDKFPPDIICM